LFDCSNCKNCWHAVVCAPLAHAAAALARSLALHDVDVTVAGGVRPGGHAEYVAGHVICAVLQTRGVTAVSQVAPDVVQFAHVAPPWPHAVSRKPASQTPFASQQPFAHDVGVQGGGGTSQAWLASQTSASCVQLVHALPPMPQALFCDPLWQTPDESQHPPGHVVGPHVLASMKKLHDCPLHASPKSAQFWHV
jgi:hypothetical protein